MKTEKHAGVCRVSRVDAVATLSDAPYLLRIPAAEGALLDEYFTALLVEKCFELGPDMHRNSAAFVVLVDLGHNAGILGKHID